jgi:integrase/recombinase XerD
MSRTDVLTMIKLRAAAALPYSTCCHGFRATGITTFMQNSGTLEHLQQIAAHGSPRTIKLYDGSRDEISLG